MRCLLILGVAAVLAAPALADDLYPPAWRGQPGSTYQQWIFSTPAGDGGNYFPEFYENSNGQPWINDPSDGQLGFGWFESWAARDGVISPYSNLNTWIPNFASPNPYKDIVIQVTWWSGVGPSGFDSVIPWPYLNGLSGVPATRVYDEVLSDNWNYTIFSFHIEPNPTEEFIQFWPGTGGGQYFVLDQLVVDTICIPEPASLLLALAGLLLRRR